MSKTRRLFAKEELYLKKKACFKRDGFILKDVD